MDVTIQERCMSLFKEFDIEAPGRTMYAKKQFFSFLSKVELQSSAGEPLARLEGQLSLLRNRYEFDLNDGRVFHFECSDRLRHVYECKSGEETYTLYEHRGLGRSIFRGDRQIAAYAKNRIAFGKGNEYQIRMDTDADLTILVCMVLALSVAEDNDDEQTAVNIDFGNLGFQGRAADESWEPR